MKKILITGANSYIGTSFKKYISENYPEDYIVDTIDMIDGSWRKTSFAGYDSVFHVAGIAHQKETEKNAPLYYNINRDLAFETAKKAREDGAKQFILLSSMSVYGLETGIITRDTMPKPKSHYGKSKLEAEQAIKPLENEAFKICILRPPMVYGKGCKGNFVKVKKIVKASPIFPFVKNERSMIHVENLASFVKKCIDYNLSGLFFPQNKEYVSTIDLARGISQAINKKIYLDYITGAGVLVLRLFHPTIKKAFGTLIYDMNEQMDFCVVSKMESIRRSV